MFLARVIGNVWSTVKWPENEGLRLLLVRPYRLDELPRDGGATTLPPVTRAEGVVVADVLGAGPGEDVIVALGHAARAGIEDLSGGRLASRPIDAAVVAIVDRFAVTPPP